MYCTIVDIVCFLGSGGGDIYVGIPTGRIYANGCRIYLYMEAGKCYVTQNHSLSICPKVIIVKMIIM
jgi:hypothetical protein